MNVQPGARLGPYEIVESIGAGGMGEVYRARDPRIGRDVAIKVLPSAVGTDKERLRRFEQEARAAGALNHPNLLTIHDIGHEEGAPYIVTELLEGETLRDRLGEDASGSGSTETSKLSPRRVIDWGVQIANGLAAAHEAGIVHRDLKPENIFVTRDGRVKILDFGLAKLQGSFELNEEDATVQRGTDPGTVMGTIAYMSPEQVRGQSLDHRSDIFSLGLVLYELASGRRAFQRETKPEIMTAILKEDPPDLKVLSPAAPPALVRIIDHCLEKHPEQRFQSARDLAFHLNEISESSGRSQIVPGQSGASRSKWLIPAAAVVIATLIGFAAGRASAPEPDSSAPTPSATELRMLTFSGRDTTPAISPDGKLMAFSSDRDGIPRIWIKQLNGGGEISLTDGPDTLPRFSPDGTALLFVRGGSNVLPSIYKVPLLGGAPRKLIDDAIAAEWSPDGETIVFLRSEPGNDLMQSLVMTSASDGSGQKEIARIEGKTMTFPRWSPDGTRISMVDNSYGNYANKPLILNRDGSEQKWIDVPVEANLKPALMWVDHERLLLGTIPGATNVVTGSGSVILTYNLKTDETRPLLYVPYPLSTVDLTTEGRIIFDTIPVRENLRYIELADDQSRWLTRGTSIDRQPAFSPDGTEVIFSSNMSGNLDLWIVSTGDGSLRRLTDDEADDFDPVFSHDGQSVFWSSRRVTGHYEIWAASADGSGARQVSHDGFDAENPTPTPDGEWIVYNSYHTEKKGLWKIRPDGTEATHLVKAESQLPEVSPDGQYASFHLISTNEVRVVRLSDGETFNLGKLNLPFNQMVNLGRSRWKPDSNIVVFIDGGNDGRTGLWEQPFIPDQDTRDQRRKFAGFDYEQLTESFGFSPDGRQLIISGVDQLNSIMISDPIPELARARP